MKTLVIGGGGFVGSAIVRQLLDKAAEVAVFGRNHYPQDVELTSETSHPALRPDGAAAFSANT